MHSNEDNTSKFRDSIDIIKELYKFFDKTKNVIFLSSFKTCVDKNSKFISGNQKYNFYLDDSMYGKTKILSEKMFIYLCNKFNKRYKILCPSHVIGNESVVKSINNLQIKKILKQKIIFYPDCFISLVNVKNIASYIEDLIDKNHLDNKKIVISDTSIQFQDYIKRIKKNKIYIGLKLNKTILFYIFLFLEKLKKYSLIKKNPIHKSQIAYLKLNPLVDTSYKNKFTIEDAIDSLED